MHVFKVLLTLKINHLQWFSKSPFPLSKNILWISVTFLCVCVCVFNLIAPLKQFTRKQTQPEVKQYNICYNKLTLSLVSLNGLIAYKWLCYYSNHLKSHIGCKCNNNTCVPSFSLVVIIFLTQQYKRTHTHKTTYCFNLDFLLYSFFLVTLNFF